MTARASPGCIHGSGITIIMPTFGSVWYCQIVLQAGPLLGMIIVDGLPSNSTLTAGYIGVLS